MATRERTTPPSPKRDAASSRRRGDASPPSPDGLGNRETQNRLAHAAEEEARSLSERILADWLAHKNAHASPSEETVRGFAEDRLGVELKRAFLPSGERLPPGVRGASIDGHVVLAADAPGPDTSDGVKLRAHEAVHVVQQGAAPPKHKKTPWRSTAVPDPAKAPRILHDDKTPLASTAGGLRVGDLTPHDKEPDWVKKMQPLIRAGNLSDLEKLYPDFTKDMGYKSQGPLSDDEQVADKIAQWVNDVERRMPEIADDGRREQVALAFEGDVALIIVRGWEGDRVVGEESDTDDFKVNPDPIVDYTNKICDTYQRLLDIFHDYTSVPIPSNVTSVPPEVAERFRRRGRVFLDFAVQKFGQLSPQCDRAEQGLAADASRIVAGEMIPGKKTVAPDRSGENIVFELLSKDPPDSAGLLALFQSVVKDVLLDAKGSQTRYLISAMAWDYSREMLLDPIRIKITDETDLGKRKKNIRSVSIDIGQLLAELSADNIAGFANDWFGALAVDLTDAQWNLFLGLIKDAQNEQQQGPPDPQLQQQPDPQQQQPSPQPQPAPPPPPVHKCVQTYYYSDVLKYFDARIGITKVDAPEFNPFLLVCQFQPNHHTVETQLSADSHLKLWKEGADRAAAALAVQMQAARTNQLQITQRVQTLSGVLGPPFTPDPPELVDQLNLQWAFWNLLQQTPLPGDLDTVEAESDAVPLEADYFFKLTAYQEYIIAGLQLVASTEEVSLTGEALVAFLKDRYPNTIALDYQVFRENLVASPSWPDVGADELKATEDLETSHKHMEAVLAQVSADRDTQIGLLLKERVFKVLSGVVKGIRTQKELNPNVADKDSLTVKEVVDELLAQQVITDAEVDAAKAIVKDALGDLQAARAAELFGKAEVALIEDDTPEAARLAARIDAVKAQLNRPVPGVSSEAILSIVKGESYNLIGLFAMAQSSYSATKGWMDKVETPGDVVRAANMLRVALEVGGATTLEGAYNWILNEDGTGFQLNVLAQLQDSEQGKKILQGSDLGFRDTFALMAGKLTGGVSLVASATALLKDSRKQGALSFLIDAEHAKDGAAKKKFIAKMAAQLRDKGPSHGKAVAKYIFSYLLDAPEQLADAEEQAKSLREEATKAKAKLDQRAKDDRNKPHKKEAGELKEEAAWKAAVAAARPDLPSDGPAGDFLEAALKEQWKNTVKVFASGYHPIHEGRELTPKEKEWWAAFEAITGADSIFPGEEGWAKTREFAEGVATAFVVGEITGGIGLLFTEGLELGVIGKALVTAGRVATFTEAMRLLQDIQTGRRPITPFLEDFIVNLVMEKAGEFAVGRMERSLEAAGAVKDGLKAKVTIFAAEYLATTGVGLLHLEYRALITGQQVTSGDVADEMLNNFAFMVGLKGMHALVAMPKTYFQHEAETWQDAGVAKDFRALKELLETRDANSEPWLKELKDAETTSDRADVLERFAKEAKDKAEDIANSGVPDAEELSKSYLDAVDLFRADAANAIALEQVGARAQGSTPDVSYEAGSANEQLLEQQFKASKENFHAEPDADGNKTYDVVTPTGVIHYIPRERAGSGGGTDKSSFTAKTRIAGERVPGKKTSDAQLSFPFADPDFMVETPGDVVLILKGAGAARSELIPTPGESFLVTSPAGAEATVTLQVGAPDSGGAGHEAGSASYTLRREGGRWLVDVTVDPKSPNDDIVRGVNHEVFEATKVIERLETAAADSTLTPDEAYPTDDLLQAAMAPEISASKPGEAPTAHDLAQLNEEVTTLYAFAKELSGPMPEGTDPDVWAQRRRNLDENVGALWNTLKLPTDAKAFESRMRDLGADVNTEALSFLRNMRFVEAYPELGLTTIDLQIVFRELVKYSPEGIEKPTFEAFIDYYKRAMRRKAEEAMKGKSGAKRLEAGLGVVRRMAGGMRTQSVRGVVAEGTSIDELNSDPDSIAVRGRLQDLPPSFKTYDAISSPGAPMPLDVKQEPVRDSNTNKTIGKEWVVRDAKGDVIARENDNGALEGTIPGRDVWLYSVKAKDPGSKSARIKEMRLAVGTEKKPTGNFVVLPSDYAAVLDTWIHAAEAKVAKLGKSATHADRAAANRELSDLKFFKEKAIISDDWSIDRLDKLIEMLKRDGIDTEKIEEDVKKAVEAWKKKKGGR